MSLIFNVLILAALSMLVSRLEPQPVLVRGDFGRRDMGRNFWDSIIGKGK